MMLVGYGMGLTSCGEATQSQGDAATVEKSVPDTPEKRCFKASTGRPQIEALSYEGQVSGAAQKLRFLIRWEDAEGDLFGGKAQFFVDGKAGEVITLNDNAFKDKASGLSELILNLSNTKVLKAKQKIEIELLLTDSWKNTSNRPLIVLETQR